MNTDRLRELQAMAAKFPKVAPPTYQNFADLQTLMEDRLITTFGLSARDVTLRATQISQETNLTTIEATVLIKQQLEQALVDRDEGYLPLGFNARNSWTVAPFPQEVDEDEIKRIDAEMRRRFAQVADQQSIDALVARTTEKLVPRKTPPDESYKTKRLLKS